MKTLFTHDTKQVKKKKWKNKIKSIKKSFIKTNGAVTENIDVIFCDCY